MSEVKEYRQLAIRIGEPYPMKDRDKQPINQQVKIMNEESAYMLGDNDMAFSCVLMDYDAFVNNPDDTNVFYEYIYCNNWNLVKDIDSPIFLRTKKVLYGGYEERWEDLPDSMIDNLRILLLSLDGKEHTLLAELMGYFNQKSRAIALKKLGI
jgi:hypothetical protein